MDVNILSLVFLLVALALSITFHEFMHAFAGNALGDDTAHLSGRLSLNPLAHIDPFLTVLLPVILFLSGSPVVFGAAKPVPFNPSKLRYGELGAALVAAAGPLTNLVVAGFVAVWLNFLPVTELAANFFILFILVNIGFFVFNMIPFPPLDGSRILYAFAPDPVRDVMRRIEAFGLVGVAVFLFVLFPLISPLMARAINILLSLLIPGFSL